MFFCNLLVFNCCNDTIWQLVDSPVFVLLNCGNPCFCNFSVVTVKPYMSCLFYPACMYSSQWITTTFFKINYYGTIYRTMKLSCELQDQRFLEEALMMCDSMMNGTANTWYSKKVKRKPSKNGNTTKRYVSFTLVPFSSIPCSSLLAWVS